MIIVKKKSSSVDTNKKYLHIVKNNILFFKIGIEKVFNSKKWLFAKKLLLQSYVDISFAYKRPKIFCLHNTTFNI